MLCSSSFSYLPWSCTPASGGADAAAHLRRAPAPRPPTRSTISHRFCWDHRSLETVSGRPGLTSTARSSAWPSGRRPYWTTATARTTSIPGNTSWMGRWCWTMISAARGPGAWTVWGKWDVTTIINTVWITEVGKRQRGGWLSLAVYWF